MLLVLVVASSALIFARSERDTYPAIDAIRPSGLKLFAELLASDGYQVVSDRYVNPDVEGAGLVICTNIVEPGSIFGEDLAEFDDTPKDPANQDAAATGEWGVFDQNLFKSVAKGTSVLWLHIGRQFDNDSLRSIKGKDLADTDISDQKYQVSYSQSTLKRAKLSMPVTFSPSTTVFYADGLSLVTSGYYKEGLVVQVRDGLGATNRYIDTKDNAKFYLNLVHSMCPPGSKIIFAEGSFDNFANSSVIDALGPWAVAIRFQFVVLIVSVCYSLGKRFGLARPDSVRETGTRELTDAIGALMHRKRKSNLAFRYLYADADARVRKALKLPAHATVQDRNARIPDELRYALNDVQVDNQFRTPTETLVAAQRLENSLQDFLVDLRRKR